MGCPRTLLKPVPGMVATMNKAQLTAKVPIGASEADVLKSLGQPLTKQKLPDHDRWHYLFPPVQKSEHRADDLGGVVIMFVSGKVSRLEWILTSI
jgi:outer membrane protein assembly factor BamE (lipoprotein component of BamABCDE complex)